MRNAVSKFTANRCFILHSIFILNFAYINSGAKCMMPCGLAAALSEP